MKLTGLNNGTIEYIPSVAARSATSKTEGNVTFSQPAVPARPPHFKAHFTLSVSHSLGSLSEDSVLKFAFLIPAASDAGLYREIEDEAARLIGPALREIADQIDRDIEQAAVQRAARLGG